MEMVDILDNKKMPLHKIAERSRKHFAVNITRLYILG